ncbi:MAG: radical SAM protein [Bacteroidetes bacterium]|nr:radical SAM protein [Bacteroidota bacterium]
MNVVEKLNLLAHDAQYDLACACGTKNSDDHRKRGAEGTWLYPATVPGGGSGILLKTLVTNACTSDCKYCPLRLNGTSRRVSLIPDELAAFFIDLCRRKNLMGIFLSSGLLDKPDKSMQLLIDTASILRYKYQYRGYIHTKIIPGASPESIIKAVSLSSAVSLNIETPGETYFSKLSSHKKYSTDIIEPLKLISSLTGKNSRYKRVKTSTQFIVGASDEPDQEIVKYMWGLYDRLNFNRIYFSAYQKGLGQPDIPGEKYIPQSPDNIFIREHRLYQSDFLIRSYGFTYKDFLFESGGNLDLSKDPKQQWADSHPDFFPISIKRSSKEELLRVPGLGPVIVNRIVKYRSSTSISSLDTIRMPKHLLKKASPYLTA